jgi:hypothetical protein
MIRPPKSIITSVKTPVAIQQQEELRLKEEQELAEEKVEEKKKEIPKPVEPKKENKVEATNAPKFQNKL